MYTICLRMSVFLAANSFAYRCKKFYVDTEHLAGDLVLQNYVQLPKYWDNWDMSSLPTASALWMIISIEGTPDGKISRGKVSRKLGEGPELRTFKLYCGG